MREWKWATRGDRSGVKVVSTIFHNFHFPFMFRLRYSSAVVIQVDQKDKATVFAALRDAFIQIPITSNRNVTFFISLFVFLQG